MGDAVVDLAAGSAIGNEPAVFETSQMSRDVALRNEGHIEGTDAFVDFREILDFEDLPKDLAKPIVLYCRSGNMSGQAATELADAGYSNIIDLSGGMNAWTASGRTLLRDGPD